MKKQSLFLACLVALALTTTRAEQTNKPAPAAEAAVVLTKFNLDFPGGTPQELVNAIQTATGKPLNAIIPEANARVKLPPLKMNNINVPQLFDALEPASRRNVGYVTSTYNNGGPPSQSYQSVMTSYGFKASGVPSDNSIWYFSVQEPAVPRLTPSKVCRFYSLAPYLDSGLKVDDITTAIQTGWKMMGDSDMPAISFHKDTELLIAVGEPDKLQPIDAVLKALEPPPRMPQIDPATGLPLPTRRQKTKQ